LLRVPARTQRLPFEQRHDQERTTPAVHVVVEDGNGEAMAHLIGHLRFAPKEAAKLWIGREVLEQELHRHPVAIAMRGCINRRRPTNPEEPRDLVFPDLGPYPHHGVLPHEEIPPRKISPKIKLHIDFRPSRMKKGLCFVIGHSRSGVS